MPDFFFHQALLPEGWVRDVRLRVDSGGTITEVVSGAAPDSSHRLEGVAVPGVPDLHSHAFQRALAGLTERGSSKGDTFWTWRDRMYSFLARLEPDDVEAIAEQLYIELVRHGYTQVTEFHYLRNDPEGRPYADAVEMAMRLHRAAGRAGPALTLLPVLYRSSDFGGRPPTAGQRRFLATVDEILTDVTLLRNRFADDPLRRVGLALHSLRAVPPRELELAVSGMRAIDADAPIHIHVAEQLREVEACVRWSGRRPVEWLLEHAPVDARWCLVHATHMTVDETLRLAASGAVAGLCPTTEANLGDGIFPLADYLVAGGACGVGSDANVSTSPASELRLLEYGQRLVHHQRNVAAGGTDRSTARTLLERAWVGGAQAGGRHAGALAPGRAADIVVLDPDHPALAGREGDELLDSWIFAGDETPVRHVVVGGRVVVRDGHHPRREEAAAAYRRAVRRLR